MSQAEEQTVLFNNDNTTNQLTENNDQLIKPESTLRNTDYPTSSIIKKWFIALIIVVSIVLISLYYYHRHYKYSHLNNMNRNNIRGGTSVNGNVYPWIASWRYGPLNCCVGSLINSDPAIILTAAHCIACGIDNQIDLARTFAPGDLSSINDISDSESFNIVSTITHDDYDPVTSSHDIMLVLLDGITNKNSISLTDPKKLTRDPSPPGSSVIIAGYGQLNAEDTQWALTLQHSSLYLWSKDQCITYIESNCDSILHDRFDPDSMICAHHPDTSNEKGDSGGPGIINGVLVGVNSWSPSDIECDIGSNILDIFTDVGSLRHWIEDYKQTTKETYIIIVHICDEIGAGTTEDIGVQIAGRGGTSDIFALNNQYMNRDYFFNENEFNLFILEDIANIGWMIDSIIFYNDNDDEICIDTTIVYRNDGVQLVSGSNEQFWLDDTHEMELVSNCGNTAFEDSDDDLSGSDIYRYYYTIIIHICDNGNDEIINYGDIWMRLYSSFYVTKWFKFDNYMNYNQYQSNGYYIFNFDNEETIGANVHQIDIQIINSDSNDNNIALCIDSIIAGKPYYPDIYKGSNEKIFILPFHEYTSVSLYCYDF